MVCTSCSMYYYVCTRQCESQIVGNNLIFLLLLGHSIWSGNRIFLSMWLAQRPGWVSSKFWIVQILVHSHINSNSFRMVQGSPTYMKITTWFPLTRFLGTPFGVVIAFSSPCGQRSALGVVSSTFQIAQFLVQSHFELPYSREQEHVSVSDMSQLLTPPKT